MANENEFTDDDVKAFEALNDQEKADIERYLKWRGQKENPGNPKPPVSPPPPVNSEAKEFGLADLKALLDDETTLSILDHLRAQKAKSPRGARENAPPRDEPRKPLAGFLSRKP
jgi:hypothetical protein